MQTTDAKGYHLSVQQACLWTWQGKGQAYSTQCAVWVKGELDLSAWLDALQSLVRRYEILRTAFHCLPGMELPVQVVTSNVEVCCRVIDLENLSASGQNAYLDEYLTSLRQKTPDLEARSLLFASLLHFSRDVHLLVMHLPALCADGYTLMRMVWELSQAYASVLKGVNQDEEPLQYTDIAAWQDQLLELEEAEALRQYWHKIDLSRLATLSLPFERKEAAKGHHLAREQKDIFAPCVFEIALEESVSAQIKNLAQQYSVSREAWLLACWEVVLWRLSEQQDLLIGVACNGRTYEGLTEELTKALGLYTRFVPVSATLHENLPFDQIVTSVNKSLLEAMKWQFYFIWKETENGAISGDFFPICFEYEYWPASFGAGELSLSLHQRFCCIEPFALKLSVLQVGERLQLEVHADPQRISSAQAHRLATALRTLLQAGIAQPQAPVSTLPLVEPDQHMSLFTMGYVPTKPEPPRGFCQLFEEQAQRLPNCLAVISAREQLTYQQLNERANRLARVLRQQGVGPNVLVGLSLARGTHMLVGLLGILKAGGAYLPLEPEIPPARLTYQLQESQSALLLTQREVNTYLLEWGGKTLCLEDLEQEISQVPAGNLPGGSGAEDLAYIIYTSGSTGVPKGVMIQQSSVVNYTLALCELLGAEPGWQYATVSTLAADLGNTAIFCALASGGCVQVLDYETVTSTEEMARSIERHPIDVLKIVPSHLSALLTGKRAKELVPRQALILGGEELPLSLLERLQECGGSCHIYNHYGPTETTIGVLVNPLGRLGVTEEKREETGTTVPLGKPITNTEVYILDRWMQVVPEEVTGELYVGGTGLAMGYLGQAEQTAERFVAHPWSRQAGARLYRTGDLARYREQGQIEFMGRCDRQVKLRGYRIELAEIQAVLSRHPQIRSSVVVLREDVPTEPRLVSYVVARQHLSLAPEQLREFLHQSLPEYMVPAISVQVDALPLTANGKIDWQSLPVPEQWSHQQRAITVGPRSPIEEMLLETWRDLLGVPELGIHDQFFLVGGHSLLAMRVMAQIQAVLHVALPVQMLFETPTVAGLAQRVEQALRQGEGMQEPPLVAMERPEAIPLSFAQQRLWFLDQLQPGSTSYLNPRALRFQGVINIKALERSLQEVVCRHESLRTTFAGTASQPVQVIHPMNCYTLPIINLQGLRQEQREGVMQWLAGQERERPCDLEKGPLLRTYVLRLERQEHVLLLTLHHIITDGWSTVVLVRELTMLYQAFVAGQPSPLVPLPVQYTDYAVWQRQWLQGEVLQGQLAYWRKQLADLSPLALPTDHPRPAVQTYRGAVQSRMLPAVFAEQLQALSRQEDVTLFMLLMTAFQILLMRYTGQTDLCVGIPIANRRQAELEGLIGFFANTLVLRTDLSGNPTFVQGLARVREVCLQAYAHQDIPFEKVVEELEPERDLSRSPLFQVMFVLQNAPLGLEEGKLAEASLMPLALESTTSKFDLTLSVAQMGDGLRCTLEYSTNLFEAETIRRMLDHWQTLLEGIVHHPQAHVSDVPLLTEGEREQLLVGWNATRKDYPQDLCVHQFFEQQVQRTPDVVALVFEDEVLTYVELNRRANQLAHYLQDLGVGPEVLVGICLERSLELVVGLLAVLKAGGAYVPLDPTYPVERLVFMQQDAHISGLLTQRQFQGQVPISEAFVIVLEQIWKRLVDEPDRNPISGASVENLAYVIYTSGSMGVPKGVQVTHRGLGNLGLAQAHTLAVRPDSRVLQFASLSFDVSILEILTALLAGASLHLNRTVQILPGADLLQVLQEQAISILMLTSSVLAVLPMEDLSALETLVVGGEPCSVELMARWATGRHFFNEYGPTEATVCASIAKCSVEQADQSSLSLGRPLANSQIYLLDRYLQPVPIGVPGEICLGGVGLARGYLHLAEQTAERFVPHPWSQELGARMYRTGDLARHRPDGTLEFLGRIDQQVKLRGYRIELGEIEAVLRQHPAVGQCLVVKREEPSDNEGLLAYVVTRSQDLLQQVRQFEWWPSVAEFYVYDDLLYQAMTNDERRNQSYQRAARKLVRALHSFLQERLPGYMVPAKLMLLDTLPLTPTGKVDRRALPAPEAMPQQQSETQQQAWTPIQELLAGLWSQVLGRRQIGLHDHFFELGGHSLLATRLIGRVREVLQVDVPLRVLFEAPTVAGLAQQVEQVLRKGQRREILPLLAGPRPEEIPLAFAQQRLWFLDQLQPGSTAYLMPSASRLLGELHVEALERSLQEVVNRHESLRTTFEERAGQPMQVIHAASNLTLPVIDLQRLRQEHTQDEARKLAKQETQCPCDLVNGPLLRMYLLRQEKQQHVMLLTLHHIISDGWSNEVFLRELISLYRAFVVREPSPLAPLPIQYADYALWQRQYLQSEVLEAQLAYWRKQLANVVPLEFPTDYPRLPVQTSPGASQLRQLPPALYEELITLSRRQDVTLFMLLLAAFQILLMRYTGQTDVSVGTLIANRTPAEVENMIGFLINALIMRIDLSDNPPFQQVLQRVRKICLEAYAHQDVPFEHLIEDLQPERDSSRSPLFQVLFQLQQVNASSQSIPELKLEPLGHYKTQANYDLEFIMIETQQGLCCKTIYNTDLFKTDTITGLLDHWQTFLQSVVQNPQARVSDMSLLSEDEHKRLLVDWNTTQRDYPQDMCVHQLFEQQAEQTPDAVALVFEEQALTYAELNRRANQLAHYLQDLGVGPEELVGICLERSLELVVGLLAGLKAGGAYVPLDPSYPTERLTFMVQDAQVSVLLTHQRLLKQVPFSVAHVVVLEAVWEKLLCQPYQSPMSTVAAENLAYVIYTSGSTGIPKGAMNTHRGVCNRLLWMQDAYRLTMEDRVAQKTPFSFDVSVWEFFWPLLNGARLVVAKPDGHRDPDYLVSLILHEQITTIHFVPSMLQSFLITQQVQACQSLRRVICSGEVLPLELQESFFACLDAQLSNLYGPTEASIDVTSWICLRKGQYHSVPIGYPIANSEIYILDAYLQPVPVGVAGELYIGGVGVGRGYLHHLELTAEKFVPHPWSQEPGARLYRTGDLVRYRSDGSIEYLGRMDQQVKIRGYRIELGEIEVVLREHPAIQEVVVLAREDGPAEKHLVVYLVPYQGHRLTIRDLRLYLQDRLPAYMLPSAWVVLDALPLMPNGKVDRRALPEPEEVQDGEQRVREGARTPIEELLVGIWGEVLGHRQVGIEENFFELGGHSLLAMRLMARVREVLQVKMPLQAVFERPTVASFARGVQEAAGKDEGMQVPPLRAMERPEEISLSFAQQRLWFLDQLEPGNTAYLIPSAQRVQGDLNIEALQRSLQDLVHRHESLRTTFEMGRQGPVQVIHPMGSSAMPLINLTGLSQEHREQEAQSLARQEAERPCELTRGPLLRTYVLRLQVLEHVLLLTLHHIITDGWSNGVFVHELTRLYQAKVSGQPSPLAPLPIQYADYALWQREWLQGEVLETQLAYWRIQLVGVLPLALPTDYPRPAMQSHRGALQVLQLPEAISQQLIALSRQEDVTLFMLLLAALQVLLHRYTGQEDISVGTPIANRSHRELEELIGFFVNTLVMRTDLSGNPTFLEALTKVRHICLEAYAHQDIPFEKVVEELEPERNLSHSPLFQVMLVLQNGAGKQEALSGVRVEPLAVESVTSKFDLTLSIGETEQGLRCSLEYNSDLFEAETITRMLGHWQTLLEGVVHNPLARLSDLPLLTEDEREQLLVEWNATQRDYPRDMCVHQLFEQQVERTPDVVALVFEQVSLTYDDLNRRANQLAYHLHTLGVRPEVMVGVCMQRSLDLVIALVAILKAGGVYVPLDPAYPAKRLDWMLEDIQPAVLLTQQRIGLTLSYPDDRQRRLDTDGHLWSQQPSTNLVSLLTPENLAYIIYTSGSTGMPKGAMVLQRGMLNHLVAKIADLQLGEQDRLAQTASQCFDISVWQLLAGLLVGGCTVIYGKEVVAQPARLVEGIRLDQISIFETVPSFLRAILESRAAWPEEERSLPTLRWLIPTGEALAWDLCHKWFDSYPDIGLVNAYGPTECSDDVTHYPLREAPVSRGGSVPIGQPVSNMRMYVLNHRLMLVPIGAIGELYIGGIGVGRGYLKDPRRTAEAFVPDPFAAEVGMRLYKTGDLVRYWLDGAIEFVGRVDQQVKIRGYRIELEEIEATLMKHPAVREVVVLAQEEAWGEKHLVAYLVVQQGQTLTMSEIHSYLHDCLPSYMIPSACMFLDALPLTPHGKVDRRALPALEVAQQEENGAKEGARTPIEELLVEIWGEVLGRREVGINENFFELGGHSLLATRLIARVRAVLQVEVPLRAVFERPTVATLAQQVQEALGKDEGVQFPSLLAKERPEEIPLSFAQQRLWFLDQLEPDSTAYLIPSTQRLQGNLNLQALHRSLQELMARHESLRTTFAMGGQRPVQVIHPVGEVAMPLINLTGLSQEHTEREAQALACQEAERPCELTKGPLLRTYVLRLQALEHVLLLTLHHIISDGWSTGVLVREFTMLYQAKVSGQPSPLAPLPIQYADYALWQREWLQGEVLEDQLAYWRKQLAGVSPLALPTDHLRPVVQTSRGAVQSRVLPAGFCEQLQALSRQQDVTLFMLLLAAFQVLLMRYTGQMDISVGTPIANRRQAQLEGLIGFFVNTLVLRTDLSGNPTLQQVLKRVREVCLGAYAHQDIPFEKVVEELEPERDLSRSPLFQVMFVLQNAPREQGELAGVSVRSLAVESTISKFDLTLSIGETGQGLHCSLEYNTDLFEAETITRMLSHWQTLLEGVVQTPQARLSDLPLLPDSERERLLVKWNTTQTDYPQDRCVHQLFEQQVEQTPDAVALIFEEEVLTYAVLNRRANQLAHHLRDLGVDPEVLVGICMERSLELVVGLLAVLKAGGAYVPLDPTYPAERLTFITQDAHISVVLRLGNRQAISPLGSPVVVNLEEIWSLLESQPGEILESEVRAENLAYVIYTSGSTGKPKGVLITHGALANHCHTIIKAYDLHPGDRVLQFSSFAFDASLEQILPTLLSGACLVLRGKEVWSTAEFYERARTFGLTVAELPTAYWHQLAQDWVHMQRSMVNDQFRLIVVSGEQMGLKHLDSWMQTPMHSARLLNSYGPTEATIGTTLFEIHSWSCNNSPFEKIPIGRPLANRSIYILDTYGNPMPIGIPGELYIAGKLLARGYLNCPELTAERFIPNSFSQEPNARLYKTGDLARYLPDGTIEFLGRVDQQVKIRGYRIELGEIETVLEEHPSIQNGIVMAREDVPGEKRLVAYAVVQSGERFTVSGIRSYLQDRLPSFMIPSAFVPLDALPLMPNGKVDRRRLPSPTWEQSQQKDEAFVGPRTALEKELASIWAEVLHMKEVGIRENFFELGGDSILSIQIVARARQRGLGLTPKQLFQYQTIEELSSVVDTGSLVQAEQGLIMGSVPLTPIQHWFFDLHLAVPQHWNQALFLEAREHLKSSFLEDLLGAWLKHHDALRLRFSPSDGVWYQWLSAAEGTLPFCVVDLSRLDELEQETAATNLAAQTQASLDIVHGPILRVVLFDKGTDRTQLLLMVIHHLAVDGVSWRILLEDLQIAYQQMMHGQAIELPTKTSSFKVWAEHLVGYAQSSIMQQEQNYWLARSDEQVHPLPVDFPLNRQVNTVASASVVSISLTTEETRILLEDVPAVYHTQINEVLLTALAQALAEWTGSSCVLVDLEGHGREDLFIDVDVSRTVGWFTSVFPVRLDLEGTYTVAETLKTVKEQLRTIPNHGIGYGILRYLSGDPVLIERLCMLPQAEVAFNYLGQFNQMTSSALVAGSSHLPVGPTHSLQGRRTHLLEINCHISASQFRMAWTYSEHIHLQSTIEHLATAFTHALRSIIQHCQSPEAGGYTPSDFPNVELSQEELEQIVIEMDH